MEILNNYILQAPTNQNILDIFKEEWSSILPDKYGLVTKPGQARLFEDNRVTWAAEIFGSFRDLNILELGPLEAGHSYMLQSMGADKIISVEANSRAFLKCLCVKEIFKLDRVEFKLGDFMSFLKEDESNYDIVFASGVLYHMEEPVELLKMISKVTDRTYIWTHYYDKSILQGRVDLAHKFCAAQSIKYDGIIYECSTQLYKESVNWPGFCGGHQLSSKWLTRESILKALKQFGFNEIQISFDAPDHINGPAFAICANK